MTDKKVLRVYRAAMMLDKYWTAGHTSKLGVSCIRCLVQDSFREACAAAKKGKRK
jgi:hypothetical protein